VQTTLSALADPTRLQIVELLRRKPLPVGEIAERLRLQQPQASKHLRVLSEAGLVKAHPVAQKRIYALRPEPFNELEAWLARYRDLMQDRMSRLEEIVEELKRKERTK
jgi:DNA-binding transcriptional ArsR family regulator